MSAVILWHVLLLTGTGKTLVARALANECSKGEKQVAFFMRKGADCLSKWIGESERQLRLLFDQVATHPFVIKSLVALCVFYFQTASVIYNVLLDLGVTFTVTLPFCGRLIKCVHLSFSLMKLMAWLPFDRVERIRSTRVLCPLCWHSWMVWTLEER